MPGRRFRAASGKAAANLGRQLDQEPDFPHSIPIKTIKLYSTARASKSAGALDLSLLFGDHLSPVYWPAKTCGGKCSRRSSGRRAFESGL